ncbi:MAG: hypothetical protein JWN32_1413, partial [Solirubrobacterales bacterium]|nr:hypothetical protein [Solirubrobacterales bacterium]
MKGAYRPFLVLLGLAVLLRVAALFLYRPSVLQWVDGLRYLRVSPHGFFSDPWSPAGYTAFLRAVHLVTPNLTVTTAAQDLLGVIGGSFVYLTVRRAGAPAWLALVPAAIPLLSGDYVFLEHILMSETLFMTLLFAGIYAAVRAHGDPHPHRWLAIAGVVLAASALVRTLTLVLPIVIAIWALVVFGGSARQRVVSALACLVPAGAVIGAYLIVSLSIGPYAGISNMSGWDLYARAAPFADCSKFTPPAGTRGLCETLPSSQRPGPFYYDWQPTSPGRRLFPHTPAGSKLPGKWAKAAILGQPLAYAKAVIKDFVRYVDPTIGANRAYSGIPYDLYQFGYRDRGEEQQIGKAIESRGYTGVLPVHAGGMRLLEDYQTVFHLGGLSTLVFAVLALFGAVRERGRRRHVILLLTVSAVLLYLLPTLTLSYDVRYGWPPAPLLAAAA